MHYNGFLKKTLDWLNIKHENSHILHHKQTLLDQTLPDDNYIEEGLVFNLIDNEVILIFIFAFFFMCLFWFYFPDFKNSFSLCIATNNKIIRYDYKIINNKLS